MILTEQQALDIAFSRNPRLKDKKFTFRSLNSESNLTKPARNFKYNYDYELCFFLGSINLGMTYTFKFSDARSVVIFDGGAEVNISKDVNAYLQQHSTGSNL